MKQLKTQRGLVLAPTKQRRSLKSYKRNLKKQREKEQKRQHQGLCVQCGTPAQKGLIRCKRCAESKRVKGRQYSIEYNRRAREEALQVYGGKCVCCEETRYEFLQFDHIDGGGNAHRKATKRAAIAPWLKSRKWPKGFQILCSNCNFAKGKYGMCPHEKERKAA